MLRPGQGPGAGCAQGQTSLQASLTRRGWGLRRETPASASSSPEPSRGLSLGPSPIPILQMRELVHMEDPSCGVTHIQAQWAVPGCVRAQGQPWGPTRSRSGWAMHLSWGCRDHAPRQDALRCQKCILSPHWGPETPNQVLLRSLLRLPASGTACVPGSCSSLRGPRPASACLSLLFFFIIF